MSDLKESIVEELRELNTWMRFRSRDDLKKVVEEKDKINKILIDQADGSKSVRDFTELVPRSLNSVHERLRKLEREGILRKNEAAKFKKLVGLEDIGLETPELDSEDDKDEQ
jgi:predicted transcriptional regulator